MINKITIIAVSEKGKELAERISRYYDEVTISRLAEVEKAFSCSDALIFIGALGICVRSIAPYIQDKHTDPAVVCIDTTGKQVISVLSGHVGGANELTVSLARLLSAEPVITTQSDNVGLWALDTLPEKYDWALGVLPKGNTTPVSDEQRNSWLNQAIALFVDRKPTALLLECPVEGGEYLIETLPSHVDLYQDLASIPVDKYSLVIAVTPWIHAYPALCIQYIPKVLHVGMGCKRDLLVDVQLLKEKILTSLREQHLSEKAICSLDSVEIKADEKALLLLAEALHVPFYTYPATELKEIEVPTPSAVVESNIGIPSVSEAAAIKASGDGLLVLPKQIYHEGDVQFTWAVALDSGEPRQKGHIEIVGAGPGDPELVSVRGKHFLQRADLILYAGSLVPKELTYYAKPGAIVRSSADMNLDEQFALMKSFYDKGKLVVRLHTGDPCLYGAIQEQMNYFDQYGMEYHITPGISAFQAAAAELKSEFTVPEKVQTIILTRGEGRTPVPEKEQLHKLAASQSTMCIYLSASIADKVEQELLQHYAPDTPVAVCYKLTWKEQRIFRGELKDLARIVRENHLTLTTLLVVGEAIGHREGLSRLYADEFKHLFRK